MLIIHGFTMDVEINGDFSFPSKATPYPVEAGADSTDHVRLEPIRFSVEGVVSDTPIGTMRQIRSGTTLPSDDALAHLLAIREAREPVTVETSLQTFDNMVLLDVHIPKNTKTGEALRFTADFEQVTLVTNERTTVVTSSPRGRKKQKLGNLVLDEVAPQFGIGGALTTASIRTVTRLTALVGYR